MAALATPLAAGRRRGFEKHRFPPPERASCAKRAQGQGQGERGRDNFSRGGGNRRASANRTRLTYRRKLRQIERNGQAGRRDTVLQRL